MQCHVTLRNATVGTVHYKHDKEPLKSFEIKVGYSPGFGLPSVAILPCLYRKRHKAIFTCYSKQCHAMPCYSMQCHAMRYQAKPCNTIQDAMHAVLPSNAIAMICDSLSCYANITFCRHDIPVFPNSTLCFLPLSRPGAAYPPGA